MIKKIFTSLLVISVLITAIVFVYFQSLAPQYDGSQQLMGLKSEAKVHFDKYGIPHIYANSDTDGYHALGYVHAQDRLWQMEVVRRIAPGRLSEIFGEKMVDTDKLFRTLGIHQYSESQASDFKKSARPFIQEAAQAYLDGINDFVANGPTPIEFTLLGIEKSSFSLIDVYNTMGYMAFSFAAAHKTEPLVTSILNQWGEDYVKDLDIAINPNTVRMPNSDLPNDAIDIALQIDQIMSELPAAPFIGSNSWVLGPDKTKSGKVILANDPHIAYSQPAVWYEAHLETPNFSFYGYHLAGFPFALIGHNRSYATGITMFENDDTDLYFEELNPKNENQYRYKDRWVNFDYRDEIIKVKDSDDVSLKIKNTVHGPIVNDALDLSTDLAPVSMFWVYTQKKAKLLELTYQFSHLENMDEMRAAAAVIHAPGLNLMYGDIANNYACFSSAHLLKRAEQATPKFIMEGKSGDNDMQGYYDFSFNPKSVNSKNGYAYSANNQPDTLKGVIHPGYYLPEDRARRITSLIEREQQWDVAKTKKMMVDVTSQNAPEVALTIVAAIDTKLLNSLAEEEAYTLLKSWDGNYASNAITPTIFNKMIYQIQEGLFLNKLGQKGFDVYLKTHLMKRSYQPLFANENSVWWDDPNTEGVENRSDIITQAFIDGIAALEAQLGTDMTQWKWGKVHTIEHNHVFSAKEALKTYFNVGPFEVPGSNEVINNYMFRWNKTGVYNVISGPSTRRIVDFDDVEGNSWSILPTGNSGNVFSPFYDNQAEMYAEGEFRKQLMNKEEIVNTAYGTLLLTP